MTPKTTAPLRRFLVLGICIASGLAKAAVQTSENFDTNWPSTPWLAASNAVNAVSGWSVTNIQLTQSFGFTSPSNGAYLAIAATNNGWAMSPWLTNPVGSVRFYVKNTVANRTNLVSIESAYDAGAANWVTNAVVSNMNTTTFNYFLINSNILQNYTTNQYIRLRRLNTSGQIPACVFDDIIVTHIPGSISLATPSRLPANPGNNEAVSILDTVTPNGFPDVYSLTNYWREWPATNWNAVAMTSNSPGVFVTSTSIPGRPAGAIIEYFVRAVYTNETGSYTLTTITNAYTVRTLATLTNMTVTGDINATLMLADNYLWKGVITLTNAINPALSFCGVNTNGVATTWGDTNQASASMPFYGVAETGATSIVLYGTNTGTFLVSFNESTLGYSIQPCSFVDFDAWSNTTYGTYTNGDWIVSDGLITNDPARSFKGQMAILNGSPNLSTNSFLQSPNLSNGVGTVSFWYRNWETTGSPAGALVVQVAPSATSTNWVSIATITNIVSTNFLNYTIGRSDRDNHCVRILNNPVGNAARLCVDEVTIAEPGATVVFTDLAHSPSVPVCTNPVNVSVAIAPLVNAGITNVALYYRPGTNAPFTNVIAMSSGGDGVYTATIPAGRGPDTGAGLVQYYVRCDFQGFGSEGVSPLFAPAPGASGPTNFVISRSYLTITNVNLSPNPPTLGNLIWITTDILPRDGASNITAIAYYRIGSNGAFSVVGMTNSGSPNGFVTTNGINPGAVIPGTPFYYAITANCAGGNPIAPTNYPPAGTNGALVAYLGASVMLSSYTNLQITGLTSNNLLLVSNYLWQGVIALSNAVDSALSFRGTSSNGLSVTWGVSTQSMSDFPYFGTASTNGTPVTLVGTNSGYFVVEFNETNRAFSVRRGYYLNFDVWSNASPYGAYTNDDGWVLTDGRTTTNSAIDIARVFRGTGRSGVLKEGPSTNAILRSPTLVNGIGQISFWYRNGQTNATPPARFDVQVATSPTSTWTTLATFTNVLSQDYLYALVPHSDLSNRYMRILNSTNAAHGALCIDEVMVTDPNASVAPANLTNSPTIPTILDNVNITVDLNSIGGAFITNAVAWFRLGTSGIFDPLPMTNAGSRWITSVPIQHPDTGTVQYTVQYMYYGFPNNQTITEFYAGGTNSPGGTFTVALPSDSRNEPFDAGWPGAPWPGASNAVNPITGWAVTNVQVSTNAGTFTSPPSGATILRSATNTAWIMSPMLSNTLDAVTFAAQNQTANRVIFIGVESSYDTNASTWVTNAIVTNFSSTVPAFSNVTVSLLDRSRSQFIRLRYYDASGSGALQLDDISVTYPPASIAISNVFLIPGYPATSDTVNVSCDIVSTNAQFPAYGFEPSLYFRKSSGTFSNLPLSRVTASTYQIPPPYTIPAYSRDIKVEYYVQCSFKGYRGAAKSLVAYYPLTASNPPASYVVNACSSSFSNLTVSVNSLPQSGRLLSNRVWQGVVNLTGASSNLTVGLTGYGRDTGQGIATNVVIWGNSNQWQSALPLSDNAGTNQPGVSISGSIPAGQYLIRFNETSLEYLVLRCAWQDFDKAGEGDGTVYKQSALSGTTAGGAQQDFDDWPCDVTLTRSEGFDAAPWTSYTAYTNGVGGDDMWLIYSAKVTKVGSAYYFQTASNVTGNSTTFAAQASHWGLDPLRGIGQISCTYAVPTNTSPMSLGIYFCPTNPFPMPPVGTLTYPDFQLLDGYWSASPPINTVTNITNMAFASTNFIVATNTTFDVIFSQMSGPSNTLYLNSVAVSDWFSEPLTVNADGWVGSGYYIEPSVGAIASSNCCRLDTTRSIDPANQFIRSPRMMDGIKYVEFYYSGTCYSGSPSNNPISFSVEVSYGDTNVWTNVLDNISTNFSNNAGTNYYYYKRTLQTTTPNLYVRIRNTTPRPGALLLDRISIPGFAATNEWYVNNLAIDYKPYQTPPLPRQFYAGAGYLNNTRSNTNGMGVGVEFPDTNRFPYIRTPLLPDGVGEVSFWYRNWATNAPVTPARLVVQSAQQDSGNETDWINTLAIITNVVNTNDYIYFRTSVYDPAGRYVRIYNDDQFTTSVGRVCLDDVLVTAPMASSICMSNLVATPTIPLATNTVDVSVDIYRLFLSPNITAVSAQFATATTYAGLAGATVSNLPMACIASNLNVPGKWYRFKTTTPIPANAIDTFVKYAAKASFDGYHSEATSPSSNKAFGVYPTWLTPLDWPTRYGTNQAYYLVFSCPTGTVWINEINVRDLTVQPKYVELCGRTGVSLSNWQIQALSSAAITQAVYTITNHCVLSNDVATGYGFWLLGDTNTANRDMTLTNTLQTLNGGLRLIRNTGVYADSIAYGSSASAVATLTNRGFKYIGIADTVGADVPMSATGTGGVNSAFTWINMGSAYTPKSTNVNQVLVAYYQDSNPLSPPAVTIVGFWVDTNIWIECTATNGWQPVPWYTTNLLGSNGWINLSSFATTYPTPSPSNTYRVNFAVPTNRASYFYSIVETNTP